MVLNLNTLKYIIEVADYGSISKVSKQFYISQPHLSNTIRTAEKELGVKLFIRSPKGMELTPTGVEFTRRAKWILNELQTFERDFINKTDEQLHLNLSLSRSYPIIKHISDFITEYIHMSNIHMNVKETNPFQVIEDLNSGFANLGIITCTEPQREYFLHQFRLHALLHTLCYKKSYYILISKNNPLANEPHIKKSMLENQAAILYGDYDSPQAPYITKNKQEDLYISEKQIQVYDRATAMDILSRCPDTYFWITYAEPDLLSQYNLVLRNVEDIHVCMYGYYLYKSEEKLTRFGKLFQKQLLLIMPPESLKD